MKNIIFLILSILIIFSNNIYSQYKFEDLFKNKKIEKNSEKIVESEIDKKTKNCENIVDFLISIKTKILGVHLLKLTRLT